jgi:hypothetical protein
MIGGVRPARIEHLSRIRELVRSGGTADLDHWGNGKFVIGEDGTWHYEGFINLFQALHEAMRAVDPAIPPGLPAHVLDPVVIARFVGIALEDTNWQGDKASAVDCQNRVQSEAVSGPDLLSKARPMQRSCYARVQWGYETLWYRC